MPQTHETEFDIDLDRLDEEWLKQPKLYYSAAKELADARLEVDRLKSMMDVAEAELHLDILAHPDTYKLEKTTDAVIKQAVIVHLSKKSVCRKLREAKHLVDLLSSYCTALEHRKRSLENLVSLHGQNYFSRPQATDDNSRKWIERQTDRKELQYKEESPNKKKKGSVR